MLTIEIVCGPHAKKRRGKDTITVARGRRPAGDGTGWIVEGIDGARVCSIFDDPMPEPPVGDPQFFGQDGMLRWFEKVASDPALISSRRVVLTCDICPESLTFADVDELRQILGDIARTELRTVSIRGLRFAQNEQKEAQGRTMR